MGLRNWRYKALAQRVFSAIPGGHRANLVFQKALGGLPISESSLVSSRELAEDHLTALSRHAPLDLDSATFFEFGAGFDLHMPLLFHALGVQRQCVVDIRPLARRELVTDIARRLPELEPPLPRDLGEPPGDGDDLGLWLERRGIYYRAPADARSTRLPDRSITCITSTNTLEHIDRSDIISILRESTRLLTDDGLMRFQIDYVDHYAYFDDSVSAYNYLRFDDREWRRYNSALHNQNRLRHSDYLALFETAGLTVVEEELVRPTNDQREALLALPLAPRFAARPIDDLEILGSRVVLGRA